MMKQITLKASVTVFALMMLGLVIGMYLVGFESPAVSLGKTVVGGTGDNMSGSFNVSVFINAIGNAIISPLGVGTIGVIIVMSALASIVTLGGGGGASTGFIVGAAMQYFIPSLIIFAVANILFFPVIPTATASGLPYPLGFLLSIIFRLPNVANR